MHILRPTLLLHDQMPGLLKRAIMLLAPAWGWPMGEFEMSVARNAIKKQTADRSTVQQLQLFLWEGTDKRGIKMKGEQTARNMNM
ncbi:hypothetical protein XEULMG905_21835, partial [Xanthomonas euvesicatoria]